MVTISQETNKKLHLSTIKSLRQLNITYPPLQWSPQSLSSAPQNFVPPPYYSPAPTQSYQSSLNFSHSQDSFPPPSNPVPSGQSFQNIPQQTSTPTLLQRMFPASNPETVRLNMGLSANYQQQPLALRTTEQRLEGDDQGNYMAIRSQSDVLYSSKTS